MRRNNGEHAILSPPARERNFSSIEMFIEFSRLHDL
jgi:hypothetical protein